MRLFIIYIIFIIPEYFLRTFVDSFKYHTAGVFLQLLPLVLLVAFSTIFYRPISDKGQTLTYFKLVGASISGYLTAKTALFIQWYWFIAPEYREVAGDMALGFAYTVFEFIIGAVIIMITYFFMAKWLKGRKILAK